MTNCYKFHGREDLLPQFNEEDEQNAANDKAEHKSHSSAIVQHNHSRASSNATVVSVVATSNFNNRIVPQGLSYSHLKVLFINYMTPFWQQLDPHCGPPPR